MAGVPIAFCYPSAFLGAATFLGDRPLLPYNGANARLEDLMSGNPKLIGQQFTWSDAGRLRVGLLIQQTVRFNHENRLTPKSLRSLAEMAQLSNHTSVRKYAQGQIANPDAYNWVVIKAIARYIYRIEFLDRQPDGTVVIHHKLPDLRGLIPYWEQDGITYRNWEDLARLGTAEFDYLESGKPRAAAPLSQAIQDAIARSGGFHVASQSVSPQLLTGIVDGAFFPSRSDLLQLADVFSTSIDTLLALRSQQFGLESEPEIRQKTVSSTPRREYAQSMTDKMLRQKILGLIQKRGGIDRFVAATPLDEAGKTRLRSFLQGIDRSLLVDDLNAIAWTLSEITNEDYSAIDLLAVKIAQVEDPEGRGRTSSQA